MNLSLNKLLKALIITVAFGIGFFIGDFSSTISKSSKVEQNVDMNTFWKVWNILDTDFVSTDHKDKFGQEISTTTITEFNKLSKEERRIYGAIQGLVNSEQDPYTTFFTPEEANSFETEIKGSFDGVGMEVGKKNGSIVVVAPIAGNPAEKAGIKAGDIILKINDTSTIGMDVDKAVDIIRGKKGTAVYLQIYRESVDKPLDFNLIRDTIRLPTLDKFNDKSTGIFTIKVYSFSEQVTSLFKQAISEFAASNSNKLILDFRGNPGGYLEAAVDLSSYFVPRGKIVVSQDYGIKKPTEHLRSMGYEDLKNKKDIKIVVLVDRGSASASEIVAGALQDYKIATILGEQTYGKGSVQEYIKVTSDTGLKVTISRWLTPNGKSISVSGLSPDIEISKATSTTIEQLKNRTDNQYLKAVEFLNK